MSSQCRDVGWMGSFPGWGRSCKPCGMACICIYIYMCVCVCVIIISEKIYPRPETQSTPQSDPSLLVHSLFFTHDSLFPLPHLTHTHTHTHTHTQAIPFVKLYLPSESCPLGPFFPRYSFFPCCPTTFRRPSIPRGDQAGITTGSLVYHQHGFVK